MLRKESMIKMRLYGYLQTVSCKVTVRTFEPGSSSLFFLTSGYLIYSNKKLYRNWIIEKTDNRQEEKRV